MPCPIPPMTSPGRRLRQPRRGRDPASACPRPADGGVSINPDDFAAFLPRIKQATEAVVNISTGGSAQEHDRGTHRPGAALLAGNVLAQHGLDELLPSTRWPKRYDTWKFDWEKDYVANSDTYIFRNTFRDIEHRGQKHWPRTTSSSSMNATMSAISTICASAWISGCSRPPIFLQFIFGILGGIGPEIDNLIFMKRTADRLFGDGLQLVGAGGGRRADGPCHARPHSWAAMCAWGWRIRSSLRAASLPTSNAEQVAKIRRIIEDLGCGDRHARRGPRDARPEGRGPRRLLIVSHPVRPQGRLQRPRLSWPFSFARLFTHTHDFGKSD